MMLLRFFGTHLGLVFDIFVMPPHPKANNFGFKINLNNFSFQTAFEVAAVVASKVAGIESGWQVANKKIASYHQEREAQNRKFRSFFQNSRTKNEKNG